MKPIFILIILCITPLTIFSQVSISLNGTPPDTSAMFDIQSNSKGILIPRMTSTQREAIPEPANGLIVYDTDTRSIWCYGDTAWFDLNVINRIFDSEDSTIRPKDAYISQNVVFGSPQLDDDGDIGHNGRMFFHKGKRAFRAGSPRDTANYPFNLGDPLGWDADSLGYYSFAGGLATKASGDLGSVALGYFSKAAGDEGSVALGAYNEASGDKGATVLGRNSEATGTTSIAIGSSVKASGGGSLAAGTLSEVTGCCGSVALGRNAFVSGISGSAAIGNSVETTGDNGSIAMGLFTKAPGSNGAFAIGSRAIAQAERSIVIGGGYYDDLDNENIFLTNHIANSLMVGFQSNIPTLFVGPSTGISQAGKVGIGTSSPQGILHVKKTNFSTGTQLLQVLESGSGNPTLLFSRGGGGTLSTGMSIEYERTGPDAFHKLFFNGFDANTLMTLHSNGKLGIGTTDPGAVISNAMLDVKNGHVVISNNYGVLSENAAQSGVGAGFDTEPDDRLRIIAGGSERLTISPAGEVGIGTTNPVERLEVSEAGNARIRITSTDNITAAIDLVRDNPNNTDWRIENGGNLKLFSSNNIDGGVTERYSFGTSIFRPSSDNAYQCGSSSFRWSRIYAANGTIQTSDIRFKKEIKPLSYGLDEILKMRPVSYAWKDGSDNKSHVGLIAQEVQEIIPEAVQADDPDHLGMNYAELVPVLINAVQALHEKSEAQEKRTRELEDEIKPHREMESRLRKLERQMKAIHQRKP